MIPTWAAHMSPDDTHTGRPCEPTNVNWVASAGREGRENRDEHNNRSLVSHCVSHLPQLIQLEVFSFQTISVSFKLSNVAFVWEDGSRIFLDFFALYHVKKLTINVAVGGPTCHRPRGTSSGRIQSE